MAKSSRDVADFLLGHYDNFVQCAGLKDGATRCAQVLQLLLADHVNHNRSNLLVAIQSDATNVFCSIERQSQFDVLVGKASCNYDCGRVVVGNALPCPSSLFK